MILAYRLICVCHDVDTLHKHAIIHLTYRSVRIVNMAPVFVRERVIMKIIKTMKAVDALKLSKNVIEVFRKHDLYCAGCKGLGQETIEKIAVCNGMDVQRFLDELNGSLE